jgi:hypothetical protein
MPSDRRKTPDSRRAGMHRVVEENKQGGPAAKLLHLAVFVAVGTFQGVTPIRRLLLPYKERDRAGGGPRSRIEAKSYRRR